MSVAARVACFQLLVLGGIAAPATVEIDYTVLGRFTASARGRGTQTIGLKRTTSAASSQRLTNEAASTRSTTSSARTRATEG